MYEHAASMQKSLTMQKVILCGKQAKKTPSNHEEKMKVCNWGKFTVNLQTQCLLPTLEAEF